MIIDGVRFCAHFVRHHVEAAFFCARAASKDLAQRMPAPAKVVDGKHPEHDNEQNGQNDDCSNMPSLTNSPGDATVCSWQGGRRRVQNNFAAIPNPLFVLLRLHPKDALPGWVGPPALVSAKCRAFDAVTEIACITITFCCCGCRRRCCCCCCR